MTQPSASSLPSENVQRGVIFALIVLPLGIVAWDILWSVGFVASIVAFGVAWAAVRLYRIGSGGRITRSGAIAVTVITSSPSRSRSCPGSSSTSSRPS